MTKIIAGNWKMNQTSQEADSLINGLLKNLGNSIENDKKILIFPPSIVLERVCSAVKNIGYISCGAQNFYPEDKGAFTGEISADMILACGAQWVLVGHSERRKIFGEKNTFLNKKVSFALKKGLNVLLCIGESDAERSAGLLSDILSFQLKGALDGCSELITPENFAVAYEPVWAIGTGKVASPADIVEAHALCRSLLIKYLGETGKNTSILYGGSVSPSNAKDIVYLDNVGGVLVGGASISAAKFTDIIKS